MIHLGTIQLLREWARWGEAQNISYPTMSPMFGERALKTPLYGAGHIPIDVWAVEQAVCRILWPQRNALILRYQRRLSFGEVGYRLGCHARTAKVRVRAAEDAVHHEITNSAGQISHAPLSFVGRSKTDTEAKASPDAGLFALGNR